MDKHPWLHLSVEFDHLLGEDTLITQKTEVEYDGYSFDLKFLVAEQNDSQSDQLYEEFRILGPKHANLIICSLLALLEAYGQPSLLNDADIQEDLAKMVQKTKDAYAEKAFEQIRDGLKSK
jgi:hypothetical protein